jgi:peptide-methionine (S)-S-oxide reductase
MLNGVLRFLAPLGLAAAVSAANFPSATVDEAKPPSSQQETAVFAGGCFWGVEAVFESLKGVKNATSGFAGGEKKTAHYEVVSTGTTGHAESVKVTYDPSQITYGELLKVYFFVAHDPTQLNRQNWDVGTQYRSAIFYANEDQKRIAEAYIQQLTEAKAFKRKIVTQVVPLQGFYAAEDYHQNYLKNHPDQPYIVANDIPKLKALREQLPQLCKR